MTNHHVLAILAEIEDFVRSTSKNEEIQGYNVLASKHPNKSYILAKTELHKKPVYVLPIMMDYFHPADRPLIANAIHRGLHNGADLSPEDMEAEMVSKEH